MFIGAAFWNAILIQAFLLSCLVLSVFGVISRWLVALPIFIYGGYYFAQFEQKNIVNTEKDVVRSNNRIPIIRFDDKDSSIFISDRHKASFFQTRYALPIFYSPEGSTRLISAKQCDEIGNLNLYTIHTYRLSDLTIPEKERPCSLNIPNEKPEHKIVELKDVDHATKYMHWLGIEKPSIDLFSDGKFIGSYLSVEVRWMPLFFYAIGCGLIDNPPSWSCFSGLFDNRQTFEFDFRNKSDYDLQASLIELNPAPDFHNFTGYPENADAVNLAQRAFDEGRKKYRKGN